MHLKFYSFFVSFIHLLKNLTNLSLGIPILKNRDSFKLTALKILKNWGKTFLIELQPFSYLSHCPAEYLWTIILKQGVN